MKSARAKIAFVSHWKSLIHLFSFRWKIFIKTEWPTNDFGIKFWYFWLAGWLVSAPMQLYCCLVNDSIYKQNQWILIQIDMFFDIRWNRSVRLNRKTQATCWARYRRIDMVDEAAKHDTCVNANMISLWFWNYNSVFSSSKSSELLCAFDQYALKWLHLWIKEIAHWTRYIQSFSINSFIHRVFWVKTFDLSLWHRAILQFMNIKYLSLMVDELAILCELITGEFLESHQLKIQIFNDFFLFTTNSAQLL